MISREMSNWLLLDVAFVVVFHKTIYYNKSIGRLPNSRIFAVAKNAIVVFATRRD